MNQAIFTEVEFFLISILSGAIILAVYDILRILRRLIKHNTFILAVEDLLFWIAASVFIFAMIYNENDGIIRGFSVMGVTLGMVLYHYILSNFIVNIITKLIQTLLRPFTFAINMVKRFFRFVFLKGKKIVNFFVRRLKKRMNSYKMKVDAKRQVLAAKRAVKAEKKAAEKKEKEEIKKAKRKPKEGTSLQEEQSMQPLPISRANQSMQPILGNKAQQRLQHEKKLEAEQRAAIETSVDIEKGMGTSSNKENQLTNLRDNKKIENSKKMENNKEIESNNRFENNKKKENKKKDVHTSKAVKGKR